MECRSVLAPMLARRVILTFWCQGVSALSLDLRQGASAFPLAMCARLCWCALAVGVALGSLHDNEPMQADEPPIVRGDAPRGLFTPRWEEVQQTYGIERPRGLRSEIFIHRVPQAYGILHRPPWDRVVATPDLWPDELIDDITGWFDDLRGRWPDEEWWVQRIHEASASSRMTILQQVNYVLITRHDFQAFAMNPHGLMELGFRDPQLHTTVLPHLINMPIIRTFLAPLWAGIRSGLTLRASLNGMTLDHQLIAAESGFYLRVTWEGSPYLVSQIEHMAISHTQQLHRHPTIITGGYIHNRGTTVYIPGGNRLIFSRKINLIGPNLQRDIEGALRARFPDLAQDNFGTGLVHLSYYLTEPVADPGWEIRLVIPVVEDDITPVILFKAVLSTYEGLGAIYVPPTLNKHTLITETGLDIVCGPQGELCACYHNGFRLGFAQLEIADLDFISCWLAEEDPLPGAPEMRNMACDSRNQPRLGSRAWARS